MQLDENIEHGVVIFAVFAAATLLVGSFLVVWNREKDHLRAIHSPTLALQFIASFVWTMAQIASHNTSVLSSEDACRTALWISWVSEGIVVTALFGFLNTMANACYPRDTVLYTPTALVGVTTLGAVVWAVLGNHFAFSDAGSNQDPTQDPARGGVSSNGVRCELDPVGDLVIDVTLFVQWSVGMVLVLYTMRVPSLFMHHGALVWAGVLGTVLMCGNIVAEVQFGSSSTTVSALHTASVALATLCLAIARTFPVVLSSMHKTQFVVGPKDVLDDGPPPIEFRSYMEQYNPNTLDALRLAWHLLRNVVCDTEWNGMRGTVSFRNKVATLEHQFGPSFLAERVATQTLMLPMDAQVKYIAPLSNVDPVPADQGGQNEDGEDGEVSMYPTTEELVGSAPTPVAVPKPGVGIAGSKSPVPESKADTSTRNPSPKPEPEPEITPAYFVGSRPDRSSLEMVLRTMKEYGLNEFIAFVLPIMEELGIPTSSGDTALEEGAGWIVYCSEVHAHAHAEAEAGGDRRIIFDETNMEFNDMLLRGHTPMLAPFPWDVLADVSREAGETTRLVAERILMWVTYLTMRTITVFANQFKTSQVTNHRVHEANTNAFLERLVHTGLLRRDIQLGVATSLPSPRRRRNRSRQRGSGFCPHIGINIRGKTRKGRRGRLLPSTSKKQNRSHHPTTTRSGSQYDAVETLEMV